MNGIYKLCLYGIMHLFAVVCYCDVYDVTDYYQAGDISYAEAIVRAITAANANNGGVIYFPPGTYQVHQSISVKKNLTIEGNSGPGGSSVIQATGSSTFNLFTCFNANASNVVFKNLVIDMNNLSGGGDVTGIGIYIHNDTNWTGANPVTGTRIENCEIKNGSSHGIRGFSTCTDYSVPFQLRIENCKIHNCARWGVIIQSVTDAIISGIEVYSCNYGGIQAYLGKNQIIKSCNIHENGTGVTKHGIEINCAVNWKVTDNTIKANYGRGIAAVTHLSTATNIENFIIADNILDGNISGNIKVAPSVDGTTLYDVHGIISDNVCYGYTGTNGIEVRLATSVIISGNICKGNTNASGIYVFGKYCVVSNNISSENSTGIYFHTTSSFSSNPLGYHEVNQNRLYSNATDIFLDTGLVNINSTLTENLAP
ncbi:MAG: right-handed parallel beta-helix repeat-containing protein [Victivallaceae bacterium]|jgi:hypothetical protein